MNTNTHAALTASGDSHIDEKLRRRSAVAGLLPNVSGLPGADSNIILDCTQVERFGLRGPGTMAWLEQAGLDVADKVNWSVTPPCGTTVLRLGEQEVFLVSALENDGQRLRDLRAHWLASDLPSKGFDAYRDEGWAWFVVSGPLAPAVMRRISMTDLRPESLQHGAVAQTRALHLDAVITRLDRFGAPSYDIFLDVASAGFALNVLQETARELDAGFELGAVTPA